MAAAGTSGWASDVGYSGELSDLATGTVAYHQRLYDPVSGTWAARDAWRGLLTAPATLNGFAFLTGDPVSQIDVLGFAGMLIDGQWGSVQAYKKAQAAKKSAAPTSAYAPGWRPGVSPKETVQQKANPQRGKRTVVSPQSPGGLVHRPNAREVLTHAQHSFNNTLIRLNEIADWVYENRQVIGNIVAGVASVGAAIACVVVTVGTCALLGIGAALVSAVNNVGIQQMDPAHAAGLLAVSLIFVGTGAAVGWGLRAAEALGHMTAGQGMWVNGVWGVPTLACTASQRC